MQVSSVEYAKQDRRVCNPASAISSLAKKQERGYHRITTLKYSRQPAICMILAMDPLSLTRSTYGGTGLTPHVYLVPFILCGVSESSHL